MAKQIGRSAAASLPIAVTPRSIVQFDDSLSGGVLLLATEHEARVLDIAARYRIDVDDPFELDEATTHLSR